MKQYLYLAHVLTNTNAMDFATIQNGVQHVVSSIRKM